MRECNGNLDNQDSNTAPEFNKEPKNRILRISVIQVTQFCRKLTAVYIGDGFADGNRNLKMNIRA